jgi:hypothetical protein
MADTQAAALTGYVNGSDLLFKVGGKAVGHCTKNELTFNSETKDKAVKPAADVAIGAASLFKSKSVTGLTISGSFEGLSFYGETEKRIGELIDAWKAGEPVEVEAFRRGQDTTPFLACKFILSNLQISAPAQDDITVSGQLENAEAPTTIDGSKINF